jgi:alkylresorcinol/alkylpyrone synthase
LPTTLADHLPDAIARFCNDAGVERESVDHWLVHPGGPQILDAVGDALGLRGDALDLSRAILRNYGNMSSPTILFILHAALRHGPTGRALLVAFGPGLTIEMVLLEISNGAQRVALGADLLSERPNP